VFIRVKNFSSKSMRLVFIFPPFWALSNRMELCTCMCVNMCFYKPFYVFVQSMNWNWRKYVVTNVYHKCTNFILVGARLVFHFTLYKKALSAHIKSIYTIHKSLIALQATFYLFVSMIWWTPKSNFPIFIFMAIFFVHRLPHNACEYVSNLYVSEEISGYVTHFDSVFTRNDV
jgi:hypothetical protein